MAHASRALLLGALLLCAALPAIAAPPAVPSATVVVVPVTAPSAAITEIPAPAVADAQALATELARRSDAAKRELQSLQRRHDATHFAPLRDAFQQRIEAVKREERLDLLAIRLRHAQANGRADDAREIAAAIEAQRKLPVATLRALPAEPAAAPIAPIVTTPAKKEAGR